MSKKIAFLIVAAGSSSRLGIRKQLIEMNKGSLLQKSINLAKNISEVDPFLVLGAYKDEIAEQIDCEGVKVIFNQDWKAGMGKSISVGLHKILQGKYAGLIICVVDQPFLNENVIRAILSKVDCNREQIIVSKYDVGSGPPTFFHRSYFSELLALDGDIGAKAIVKKYIDRVEYIAFEKGSFDIDTKEDLSKIEIIEKYHNK
jgi:molybdenum cofactor cytidylyltransferase